MGGAQSKKLTKKLEAGEIEKINVLFNDLAVTVKNNKVIDRDGFKRFHMIPEPLSDRIFQLFESKKHHMSLDDLVSGLAVIGKAGEKEKIDIIFQFLDLDDDGVISKEELQVLTIVSLESPNSPKFNSTPATTTPVKSKEDPIIEQFVGMGFSKHKVQTALKRTLDPNQPHGSDADVEKVLNWLEQHKNDIDIDEGDEEKKEVVSTPGSNTSSKPDPKTIEELTIGLNLSTILTTFESLFENPILKDASAKINIKHFRKWATASKRPAELDSLLKPMMALYDRALKWKQSIIDQSNGLDRSVSNESLGQSNASIKDSSSSTVTNPKELKRFSSVSSIDNMKSSTSTLSKEERKAAEKREKELKKETPKKVDKSDKSGSASSLKDSTPTKDINTSTSTLSKKDSTMSLDEIKSSSSSTVKSPVATSTIPEKKEKKAKSGDDDSFDSFDSDSEEEQLKPAIQVVIRDKPIELQKNNSLFNIDPSINLSKPVTNVKGSQTLKLRGTRASNRYTMDPDIFQSFQPLQPSSKPLSPPINVSANKSLSSNNLLSPSTLSPSKQPTISESTPILNQDSVEFMKGSIEKLENGEFQEAIQDIDKCIKTLLSAHSSNPKLIQSEINFIVGYKVALTILTHIKSLESRVVATLASNNNNIQDEEVKSLYQRLALLSKLLVDIPLQGKHRIVSAKMAIHYNIISENFGIAETLLEVLKEYQQHSTDSVKIDSQIIDALLNQCNENKKQNNSLPLYICPSCKSTTSLDHSACATCNRPIRWCFQSLEIIKELTVLLCDFCNSSFSIDQNEVIPNKSCTICFSGKVTSK